MATKPFNIIFAGTPEFAVPSLKALKDAGHHILAVYTQPDRPAGRGQKLQASPVKMFAQKNNLPIQQPETLKDPEAQAILTSYKPDIMVVAAYGLLLPKAVLAIPRLGCINIHASWLPRWRGAAPIQRAILAGDTETGISIMQMAEGLDTGDVLCLQGCQISDIDNAQSLHDKLAVLGAEAIVEALEQISNGIEIRTPQESSLVTYAAKITKEESKIHWEQDALVLDRVVRAYNPYPLAYTSINGQLLRILSAAPIAVQADLPPGTIVEVNKQGVHVACGNGMLQIKEIQWPNRSRQSIKDALNANKHPFIPGERFDLNV